LNHEDTLTTVTVGVRVLQDVDQVATLDVEDDVLEPNAPSRLEFRVPCVVPGKVFSLPGKQHDVCLRQSSNSTDNRAMST
jgi:hypothetical protein